MWLRITAYAISQTFDMMSCPGQPWLATHCRLLLFRPVIDILQCLRDRIQGPEGPGNQYTGLSSAKRSWLPYHRDIWTSVFVSFETIQYSTMSTCVQEKARRWRLVVTVQAHIVVGWLGPRGGGSTNNSKISKNQTAGLWRRFIKKELDIMRFRHNEVNFELTCESHQNTSKTYFMNTLRCFDNH